MKIILIVISYFYVFLLSSPAIATSQMTQASMDVGNIISIIIPDSFESNIDVDQLTSDFRRQLERIRQQSHINKLENGLVTLKKVLPEMLNDKRKKMLALLRRILSKSKNMNQIQNISFRNVNSRISQRKNNYRQPINNASKSNMFQKYYYHQNENIPSLKRPMAYGEKFDHENSKVDLQEINNWNKFRSISNQGKSPEKIPNRNERNQRTSLQPNQRISNESPPLINIESHHQSEKFLIKNISNEECTSLVFIDIDGQIYSICNNTNLLNVPEIAKEETEKLDNITQNTSENDEKMVIPINIEVEDLKSVEKIMENPQTTLKHLNSSEMNLDDYRMKITNNMLRRSSEPNQFDLSTDINKNDQNIFEYHGKIRDFMSKTPDNNDKQTETTSRTLGYHHVNIPKVTHELNFDNGNFEIRIQRSVDDNIQLKKSINSQIYDISTENNSIKLKPIMREQLDLIMYPKPKTNYKQ